MLVILLLGMLESIEELLMVESHMGDCLLPVQQSFFAPASFSLVYSSNSKYFNSIGKEEWLPGKGTGSWELRHSLKLDSTFLKLLFHISRFVTDQDVKQKIFVASEHWFVSRLTPVYIELNSILEKQITSSMNFDYTCKDCRSW